MYTNPLQPLIAAFVPLALPPFACLSGPGWLSGWLTAGWLAGWLASSISISVD